jgi:hypothetical protein
MALSFIPLRQPNVLNLAPSAGVHNEQYFLWEERTKPHNCRKHELAI